MFKNYLLFVSKNKLGIMLPVLISVSLFHHQMTANESFHHSLLKVHSLENEIPLQRTITKNTTASQLDEIVAFFKKEGIKVVFSKLKRNRDYEIIKIKVVVVNGQNKIEWNTADNVVIQPFTIDAVKSGEKIVDVAFNKPIEPSYGHSMFVNKINETAANEIIAQQGNNDEQVYKSIQNEVIYQIKDDQNNANNNIVIVQKRDDNAVETKTGIEIISSLTKNANIDVQKTLLFLNGKPISKDDLSIIKNQDGLTLIVTDPQDGVEKFGPQGKNGAIEIFQDGIEMNQTSNHQNVQAAMKMMQEARKDMNIEQGRTSQIRMSAEHNNFENKKNGNSVANDKISIVESKAPTSNDEEVKPNSSTVEVIHGKNVVTNNVLTKSGMLIKSTTSDNELESYKKIMESDRLTFEYKNIQRNKFGMITGIEITLKSGYKVVSAQWLTPQNEKGIPTIFVGKINGELSVKSME
ncbi:MAG: hypothetical protein ACOVLC_03180 [Flavobacterium sp.]